MVKIYYKKLYIPSAMLRGSKLVSKHFRTNTTYTFIIPLFL